MYVYIMVSKIKNKMSSYIYIMVIYEYIDNVLYIIDTNKQTFFCGVMIYNEDDEG